MSTYNFLFDLHSFSTNAISTNGVTVYLNDPYTICGGDNFDIVNCKKSDVKKVQGYIDAWKEAMGDRYIFGNHEAQRDNDRMYKIRGTRVGVMHGDLIMWGKKKSEKYRRKDHGAGFLKRGLWVNALEAFENGYNRKVNDEDLERFYEQCILHDVDRIIIGHMHPEKQIDIIYKGKHLTICKRGLTVIEL